MSEQVRWWRHSVALQMTPTATFRLCSETAMMETEEEEETKDVFAQDLSCLATQPAPGVENKTKKKEERNWQTASKEGSR